MSKEDDIMVAEGRAFDSKIEYLIHVNATLMDELEKISAELTDLQAEHEEQVIMNANAMQKLYLALEALDGSFITMIKGGIDNE